MITLNEEATKGVCRLLSALRSPVKEDLAQWNEFIPGKEFYSNECALELLPYATSEYLLIEQGLRLNRKIIIECFNMGFFEGKTHLLIEYTLKRLAVRNPERKNKS